MSEQHQSDKDLVKELVTYIDVAVAEWYNLKCESHTGYTRDELMRVVNEAVFQYYQANRG